MRHPVSEASAPRQDEPNDLGPTESPVGTSAVAHLARSERPASASDNADVSVVRAVTGLAIFATIFGRAVGPAVPGSAAGIEGTIAVTSFIAGALTQAFVFAGTALGVWLLLLTLRHRDLPLAYRVVVVPGGAAVTTLVMMSAREPLSYSPTVLMAVLTNIAILASTIPTIHRRETRAVGLALTVTSLSSLAYVAARVLALRASEDAIPSMFGMARAVATAGLAFDVASILIIGVWVAARDWKRSLAVAILTALAAATISWAAAHGSADGAPIWQVLASRSLGEIVRNPAPLVATEFRYFVQVIGWFAAIAAFLAARSSLRIVTCAAALLLLARASSDVPLGALSMVLATLLTAIAASRYFSADEASEARS